MAKFIDDLKNIKFFDYDVAALENEVFKNCMYAKQLDGLTSNMEKMVGKKNSARNRAEIEESHFDYRRVLQEVENGFMNVALLWAYHTAAEKIFAAKDKADSIARNARDKEKQFSSTKTFYNLLQKSEKAIRKIDRLYEDAKFLIESIRTGSEEDKADSMKDMAALQWLCDKTLRNLEKTQSAFGEKGHYFLAKYYDIEDNISRLAEQRRIAITSLLLNSRMEYAEQMRWQRQSQIFCPKRRDKHGAVEHRDRVSC
ncbi:hypothetical protein MHBO_000382 [Bonamia ostreae]|uniref:Uncharacterized protein n=1 Tax=Bonamia ostreae TaxID=126728 RepID=A0ABV2AG30_9EUKA